MKTYLRKIVRFIDGEEGASAAEYVLLITLIAVAILAGATTFGTSLAEMYDRLASQANSLIN